jgi:tetratricopeptide (TPR) repeat protein
MIYQFTKSRIRPGLAILVLSLAAAGVGVRLWLRERPERYLREAERLLAEGSWDQADPWLDLPEHEKATRDRALILRVRVALESGRLRDAVAPLQRVDPRGPQGTEAAYWKARTLYAVGNTTLAILWFRTALEARPADAETLRWLATAAYDLGDRRTLHESLETLTKVKPDDARAWRTLALVTWTDPGAGELELGAARVAYERSLRLDPSQPAARLELAEVLVKMGGYEQAERQLALCLGKVPEANRTYLLAQSAWFQGKGDRCRDLAADGLTRAPNHPGLLSQKALLAQSEGRFAEAVAGFDRAVTADPYNSQWTYMRSVALRAMGRPEAADRDAARSAELKKAGASLSDLTAEATHRPTDPAVRIRLGRVCEVLGRPELAVMWYRAALACDPRNDEARSALAAVTSR